MGSFGTKERIEKYQKRIAAQNEMSEELVFKTSEQKMTIKKLEKTIERLTSSIYEFEQDLNDADKQINLKAKEITHLKTLLANKSTENSKK